MSSFLQSLPAKLKTGTRKDSEDVDVAEKNETGSDEDTDKGLEKIADDQDPDLSPGSLTFEEGMFLATVIELELI